MVKECFAGLMTTEYVATKVASSIMSSRGMAFWSGRLKRDMWVNFSMVSIMVRGHLSGLTRRMLIGVSGNLER